MAKALIEFQLTQKDKADVDVIRAKSGSDRENAREVHWDAFCSKIGIIKEGIKPIAGRFGWFEAEMR